MTLGLPRVTQFAAERRYFLHTNDTENPMAAADIFNKIGENIAKNPEAATSIDAIFQFDLSGDGGGVWVINVAEGNTSDFVTEGASDSATCTISCTAADWDGITGGSINPMQAFMMGKIKVSGDMGKAMQLQKVLSLAN
ncbi:MAG: putative sterol carrier protein [Bradymonadia bacterium]